MFLKTILYQQTLLAFRVSVWSGVNRITYWSQGVASLPRKCHPYPPLDNIRVIVIVWRLRGNIIRTAPCWVVWHNVHSQQHTQVSSSYRSSKLGLSHWDPYAMHRGGCLELCYCNIVEWSWWDSGLIWKTNWFPSVLWHCCFRHITCKNRPRYDLWCVWWDVKPYSIYLSGGAVITSLYYWSWVAANCKMDIILLS